MSTEREIDPVAKPAFAEGEIRLALLAYADFPSGEVRMWTGVGTLFAEGYEWQGIGGLLSVTDVTETTDSAQNGMAVRLSGIPSQIFDVAMLGDYQNRRGEISLLVFDRDLSPLGAPTRLFAGLMDSSSVKDDATEVSVTIDLESALSDQLRARIFRYTHEGQQTLYRDGGDKGLEFVAALQNLSLRWGQ